MTAVLFENVEKRFDGGVTALKSLTLAAPDRTFVALLGPSGCGKTTALRILAGLEMPTSGRVLIGGRDVTRLQPRDRDLAMVFQSYALYPHMTIRDNIAYPLWLREVPEADRKAKVDAVYAKAMALGASDEGKPGQRGEGFYGAYFRDLDGNKLNVFFAGWRRPCGPRWRPGCRPGRCTATRVTRASRGAPRWPWPWSTKATGPKRTASRGSTTGAPRRPCC